jgi:uncharacterized protein
VVKVKVLEVDVKRRRIGLTMKLSDAAPSNTGSRPQSGERSNGGNAKGLLHSSGKPSGQRQQASSVPVGNTAFAEAFAKLKAKK